MVAAPCKGGLLGWNAWNSQVHISQAYECLKGEFQTNRRCSHSHHSRLISATELKEQTKVPYSMPHDGIPHFNLLKTQWFDYFIIFLYGLVFRPWPIHLQLFFYDHLLFLSPFWLTLATKQYSRDSVTKTGSCVTYLGCGNDPHTDFG